VTRRDAPRAAGAGKIVHEPHEKREQARLSFAFVSFVWFVDQPNGADAPLTSPNGPR
jgi:hypothetical protein